MNKLKGTLSLIFAVVSYGMYGVYSRVIGLEFGAFSQNWVRNLIVIFLLAFYLFSKKGRWLKIKKEDVKWILFWTLSGSLTTVGFFVAVNKIPVGTTYFVLYSGMIISGYVSGKVFFKERMNLTKIISVLLAFLGLALIYSIDVTPESTIWAAIAVTAGILTGLWNTLSKKVSHKYPNFQLVFIDASVAFFVSVIGALLLREKVPALQLDISWLGIFFYGITQISAVGFIIYGFKNLEAQIGSIIMPLEVVFGALFGLIFFGEVLPVSTIIGGLLIASAAVLPSLVFLVRKK